MRRKTGWLLVGLWVLLIGTFVWAGMTFGWRVVTPVIAYNRPRGPFGWPFLILFWISVIRGVYFHGVLRLFTSHHGG
ncbi:hypothetical protein ACS4N0_02840 [Levilactobacillus zymae]|uniref:hypothetical protein n=1 Tax=Levilactobacillus zymae TaxID=267363 RepID=UPI003FCC3F30